MKFVVLFEDDETVGAYVPAQIHAGTSGVPGAAGDQDTSSRAT